MPEQDEKSFLEEIKSIYGDTNYFIDAITEEYGFYGFFIDAMRAGSSTVNVSRKTIHKTIEGQWMSAIEAVLPTLDYVVRNYSIGMQEREEVMPIERSKKINNRSIRHLAQHTDYIKDITEDSITPSKILNVFNEETLNTYENKFVNTLVQRLYTFVDKRYVVLSGSGLTQTGVGVEFDSKFKFGKSEGKLSLKIEVSDPIDNPEENDSLARLEKMRSAVIRLMNSPFIKEMGNEYIRPPVMRTNAISKNKYLRECLDLWDFIESYEKLGYLVESEDQSEKPNDEFIREIYSLMSLQYLMFDYNIHQGYENNPEVLAAKRSNQPLYPRLLTHFRKEETKDYNSYDTEYRKVVNLPDMSAKRTPTIGETQIRNAIEDALAVDREMTRHPYKK